jgi:hypothetical protein
MRRNRNRNRNNYGERNGILNTVRKNKRQNNNKQVVLTSQLPMIVRKNVKSAVVKSTIKVQTVIQSFTGSPQYIFQQPLSNNWNIGTILQASDTFGDFLTNYGLFRITGIKMDVQRTVSDAQLILVYPTLLGSFPPAFVLFAPNQTSTGASIQNVRESSVTCEIDPFVSTRQRVSFNFPPMFCYNNSSTAIGSTHAYGMWNSLTSSYINMPGELLVASTNTSVNAVSTTPIYAVTAYIDCEFAYDYAA